MDSKFVLPFGDIFEKMNPDRVFVYDTDIEDNIKFKKIKLISLYDYHYDSYYLDDDIVDKIKKLCNLLIKKIKVETNNDYVNHIVDGLDIIFLQQHLDDKQYNFFQRIINLVLYFKTIKFNDKNIIINLLYNNENFTSIKSSIKRCYYNLIDNPYNIDKLYIEPIMELVIEHLLNIEN